jgi:hypothetical protein
MRRRPLAGPALVVSIVALIVALGGVGYTASKLPRNSVGRAQLRDTAVSEAELARAAVTSAKVRDKSLLGVDIDQSTLGKVQAATLADTAKVAETVAGLSVRGVASTIPLGGWARVVGGDGGLEVHASCSDGGRVAVELRSAAEHALVRASVVAQTAPAPGTSNVFEDADFGTGESLSIFGPTGAGTAQVVYLATDGHVTSAVLAFGAMTGSQTCSVAGTLVRS